MKQGEKRKSSFHSHKTSGVAFPTPRDENETGIEEVRRFNGRRSTSCVKRWTSGKIGRGKDRMRGKIV